MNYNEACLPYPACFLIIAPDTGNIVATNEKAASTFGSSLSQLCTMKIYDMHILEPECLRKQIHLITEKLNTSVLFSHQKTSGEVIQMEGVCYPISFPQATSLFSSLYPSKESPSFMKNAPDALMILDQSHKIIKLNQGFETMFMCKESEVLGESGYTLLHEIEREKYQLLLDVLENAKEEIITFQRTILNQTFDYSLTATPLFQGQTYFGSVLSIRHICHEKTQTVKKNLELTQKLMQLEKTHSEKNDFLARMSHDMRTPMNAILSIAQFGLEDIEDKKAHKYFSQIKDSSEYLLALINDILDMQKLESGQITLKEEIINASRVSEKVKTIIEPRASQKGITLTYDLECEQVYRFVKVDEKRVEQILTQVSQKKFGSNLRFLTNS